MSSTVHLYRRESAKVMRSTCAVRPFFSEDEQQEIALLAEAARLRRAALHDLGPVVEPATAPLSAHTHRHLPRGEPDGTWRLVDLARLFVQTQDALGLA
ncbi:MAG: hypothetical protein V4505_14855 [Pseudomonadota bacterium]